MKWVNEWQLKVDGKEEAFCLLKLLGKIIGTFISKGKALGKSFSKGRFNKFSNVKFQNQKQTINVRCGKNTCYYVSREKHFTFCRGFLREMKSRKTLSTRRAMIFKKAKNVQNYHKIKTRWIVGGIEDDTEMCCTDGKLQPKIYFG